MQTKLTMTISTKAQIMHHPLLCSERMEIKKEIDTITTLCEKYIREGRGLDVFAVCLFRVNLLHGHYYLLKAGHIERACIHYVKSFPELKQILLQSMGEYVELMKKNGYHYQFNNLKSKQKIK